MNKPRFKAEEVTGCLNKVVAAHRMRGIVGLSKREIRNILEACGCPKGSYFWAEFVKARQIVPSKEKDKWIWNPGIDTFKVKGIREIYDRSRSVIRNLKTRASKTPVVEEPEVVEPVVLLEDEIQKSIRILKSNGYVIYRPVTSYELV